MPYTPTLSLYTKNCNYLRSTSIYLHLSNCSSSGFIRMILMFQETLSVHYRNFLKDPNFSMDAATESLGPKILWIPYLRVLTLLFPPILDCWIFTKNQSSSQSLLPTPKDHPGMVSSLAVLLTSCLTFNKSNNV